MRFSFAYSSGVSWACCSSCAACFSCVRIEVTMALRVSEMRVEANSAKPISAALARLVAMLMRLYCHWLVVCLEVDLYAAVDLDLAS